ncbi:MAG: Asp-tRNA(Asn)/Glu-tRNA(Gln) amidotransferase subunit GatB [Legionella sp.]|nr:Asp-tRNA(Asn)/Glu-tRNA(Gln) amidotransferase subunit GatB [Legionella sp.]
MDWDIVIGLEVHAQLKTKSKLFSGAATTFGALPNSQTCFIDAGLPGVLPVLNEQAVVMAIQVGLAIGADINDGSVFERKNYFYPDLPKGYQISQLQKPIVSNGSLPIGLADGTIKTIEIVRAHLEEDAGKSLHEMHSNFSSIDLNRAGIPLLEIVTAPCLFSAEEVICYLKTLHQLLRFLGVCDGNMQEGSFRVDVNISLKPKGSATLGIRTELKNLNSFRFIEKAIACEYTRHEALLESQQSIKQETRLYNPDTNTTYAMREKQFENDYRYFPDPDLLPIQITRYQIAEIKSKLPDLPKDIYKQLSTLPGLNEEDILFVLSSPAAYRYYKDIKNCSYSSDKLIINWLKGPYAAALNDQNLSFEQPPMSAQTLAKLLNKLHEKVLSTSTAKTIFTELLSTPEADIEAIILREGHDTIACDQHLESIIKTLINQFPNQAADYKAGKDKLLSFFVGQVMKQMQGKANPEVVSGVLKKYLDS